MGSASIHGLLKREVSCFLLSRQAVSASELFLFFFLLVD